VSVADGSLVTHGQLVAAASAPPRQHRPAVLALHPGAKSVRLGAFAIIRLKRSFGHFGDSFRASVNNAALDAQKRRRTGAIGSQRLRFQYSRGFGHNSTVGGGVNRDVVAAAGAPVYRRACQPPMI
jgi:hypothetical protein